MKFMIRQTSKYGDKPDVKGVVEEIMPFYLHRRTCSEEQYNRLFAKSEGGEWRSIGYDHTTYSGGIERKETTNETAWFLNVEDVIEFVKEHGECVISVSECGFPVLEIYDYYRE